MVRKFIAACVAIGLCGWGQNPAHAGYFKDGNDLYADCTVSASSATYYQSSSACTAYVLGVVDGIVLSREIVGLGDCMPESIRAGQIRDVVLNYLRDNPGNRHYSAAILIRMAVVSTWPACAGSP